MKITAAGATDPGKRRGNNEDSFLIDDSLLLYAVADGVGGSEGGEVASRIAVETLNKEMKDMLGSVNRTPPVGRSSDTSSEFAILRSIVRLANRNIHQARAERPSLSDMATTLTMLLLRNKLVYLAHMGDSRAYLLRAGELEQLTNDHSFVAEQVRAGAFTSEQARSSPYRHVITRAVGITEEAQPDVLQHDVQQDDRFLLCTDGLTEMVPDEEICRILAAAPQEAVRSLIAAANNAGGVDNITAVVVRVTEI